MQSETLDYLHRALGVTASCVSRSVRERMVIIGSFLECLERSLGYVLGSADAIPLERWPVELGNAGVSVHHGDFAFLIAGKHKRNQFAHSNSTGWVGADRALTRHIDDFSEALETLYRALATIGLHERFVEHLYATQEALEYVAAGRRFELAVAKAFVDPTRRGDALVVAAEAPLAASGQLQIIRRTPPEHRGSHVVRAIARLQNHIKLFVETARHLQQLAPDDEGPLAAWIISVGGDAAVSEDRLSSVLRLTLDPDPRDANAFLITNAVLVTDHGDTAANYPLPIRVPTRQALVAKICEVKNSFRLPAHELSRVVLQLDVPSTLACESFEETTHGTYRLLSHFACVTASPSRDERLPSAHLGNVIAYPGAQTTSARFDLAPGARLGDELLGKLCVFAAQCAWWPASGETVSPFVAAFGPYPLAVLEHRDDLTPPLDMLFGGRAEQPIFDFFLRITERRKQNERITVLWDDERYSPVSAVSV